jgi:hypothetical protein
LVELLPHFAVQCSYAEFSNEVTPPLVTAEKLFLVTKFPLGVREFAFGVPTSLNSFIVARKELRITSKDTNINVIIHNSLSFELFSPAALSACVYDTVLQQKEINLAILA